jgi:DNA-binding NtrC family response regulator
VLIVDDDPDLLRAVAAELSDDADVTTCDSVTAALPLVARGSFDAVVTDLRMPDRWGDELLAHVAARSPTTLRFLLTGDSDPRRTIRELLEVGLVEHVFSKPRVDGLVEALRNLAAFRRPTPGPGEESPTPTS